MKWETPDIHYIKLNFDGSVKPHYQAASGFVIRDSQVSRHLNFGYITKNWLF
jgi:hypothetical protein